MLLKENQINSDYKLICNSLLQTANDRSYTKLTEDEVFNLLKKHGFTKIQTFNNNSDGVMSTFICTKR